MAKSAGLGLLGLAAVLLGVLIVVPFLKRRFPQYYEGFQTPETDMRLAALMASGQADSAHPDCVGMTCPEGQFCQNNKCIRIFPGPGYA